jgi:hypothetical protein
MVKQKAAWQPYYKNTTCVKYSVIDILQLTHSFNEKDIFMQI